MRTLFEGRRGTELKYGDLHGVHEYGVSDFILGSVRNCFVCLFFRGGVFADSWVRLPQKGGIRGDEDVREPSSSLIPLRRLFFCLTFAPPPKKQTFP